jgi:hypothetical protein
VRALVHERPAADGTERERDRLAALLVAERGAPVAGVAELEAVGEDRRPVGVEDLDEGAALVEAVVVAAPVTAVIRVQVPAEPLRPVLVLDVAVVPLDRVADAREPPGKAELPDAARAELPLGAVG